MPTLEEIAYNRTKVGIPDRIKQTYDDGLKSIGKKLWRGMAKVSASGFGKGVLTMGAIVLLGGAIFFGMGAASGAIIVGDALLGPTTATIGQGIAIGLAQAGNLLWSGMGAALLAVGGTLGAVSDVRKHQNKLTAEMARAESEAYARQREAGRVHDIQMLRDAAPHTESSINPEGAMKDDRYSFCAKEMARREAQASNPYRANHGRQ